MFLSGSIRALFGFNHCNPLVISKYLLQAITRYLLQKLFGPTGARVTSDGSILYLDLPSNMVKILMYSS